MVHGLAELELLGRLPFAKPTLERIEVDIAHAKGLEEPSDGRYVEGHGGGLWARWLPV